MLYATTRTDRDIYTIQRALTEKRAPDLGLYVPFRENRFSPGELLALQEKGPMDNLAAVMNRLFKSQLTGWDLELAVGRRPLQLRKLGRKTAAGERWHNTGGCFSCLAKDLTNRLGSEDVPCTEPGIWALVAGGIGSLFSLFAMMRQEGYLSGSETVDLAVAEGDLLSIVSGWFARSWGLPVGTIICGSREDGILWELTHTGQLKTQGLTEREGAAGLELLIYCCGGRREVERLTDAIFADMAYKPSESTLLRLQSGLSVDVISQRRIRSTVPSVYSAHNYLLHPQSVLAYAGLLDYRAKTGESGWGMILCDRDPAQEAGMIAEILGTTPQAVRDRLRNSK